MDDMRGLAPQRLLDAVDGHNPDGGGESADYGTSLLIYANLRRKSSDFDLM
jgi:hypothetical protein